MSPIILPGSGLSLTEYRAAIASKGYDSSATTVIDVAVNAARRKFFGVHRWTFLESVATPAVTTAGEPTVSLTAIPDLLYLDAVRLDDTTEGGDLDYVPAQEFRSRESDTPASGRPADWTVAGGNLRFYPVPERAYGVELDVCLLPNDLVNPADVCVIPVTYSEVVVWMAIADTMAFRQRDRGAMADAASAAREALKVAISADNTAQRQTATQVRGGYWGP